MGGYEIVPRHPVGRRSSRRSHLSRSPRRSRNTACSPNRFHTHHGMLTAPAAPRVEGRRALRAGADTRHRATKSRMVQKVDVGGVVPGLGQVVGHRHATAEEQLAGAPANGRNSGRRRWPGGRCERCSSTTRAGGSPGCLERIRSRRRRRGSRRGPCPRRPGSRRALGEAGADPSRDSRCRGRRRRGVAQRASRSVAAADVEHAGAGLDHAGDEERSRRAAPPLVDGRAGRGGARGAGR
jgi:hypothetical protein